ncbi:hypothetical protein, partial [Cupriavidus sp. HMR-1]|uniref:hypothetical protein n=1 Tax=Cupriavidus sp. HMR-1 TaxID=1249621 RepID=UPI0019D3D974
RGRRRVAGLGEHGQHGGADLVGGGGEAGHGSFRRRISAYLTHIPNVRKAIYVLLGKTKDG